MNTDDTRPTDVSPPLDEQSERPTMPPPPPDAPATLEALMHEVRYGNRMTAKLAGSLKSLQHGEHNAIEAVDKLGGRVLELEQSRCAFSRAFKAALDAEPADPALRKRFLPVLDVLNKPCGPVKEQLDETT